MNVAYKEDASQCRGCGRIKNIEYREDEPHLCATCIEQQLVVGKKTLDTSGQRHNGDELLHETWGNKR